MNDAWRLTGLHCVSLALGVTLPKVEALYPLDFNMHGEVAHYVWRVWSSGVLDAPACFPAQFSEYSSALALTAFTFVA